LANGADLRLSEGLPLALGVQRAAGMSSQVEVASDLAVVFVVRNSQILLLDSYNNWKAALEAAGLRE
jgi:hypothetical protein